jgi:glycogen synthase
VPFIYDSHELWSGRPAAGARWPGLAQVDQRLERELGARASAVLTVGEGLADVLRERYGWRHLRVVHNSFPLRTSVPALPEAPTGLVYAGRLAADRELEVIAAASRLVDLRIERPVSDRHRRVRACLTSAGQAAFDGQWPRCAPLLAAATVAL